MKLIDYWIIDVVMKSKTSSNIHDLQCKLADIVHQKYQQELYSLSACGLDYTEHVAEEYKLHIGLLQSGVTCPRKKPKIHAALHTNPVCSTISSGGIVVFQFVQINPSGTWIIPHNLGYNPQVEVYDIHGNPIPGSVRYLDSNTLQIIFNTITGGRANLYNQ